MRIDQLITGPLETNCYVVSDSASHEVMIIDPGGDAPVILEALRRLGPQAEPRWLVNTHGHGDHIGANGEIKKAFPDILIAVHAHDAAALTSPARNLSPLVGMAIRSPAPDVQLKNGQTIELGARQFIVIHTPGHSPGGICLYKAGNSSDAPVLFSGDTLFAQSIGRADLPGGDMCSLLLSIREKLLPLPDATVVYPGHGSATTLGEERRHNPFVPQALNASGD